MSNRPDLHSFGHEDPGVDYFAAISAYARHRLPQLVAKVVYRLQRIPASGAHGGDYDLRTLWNEFSWEVQNGDGDLLADLLDDTIRDIVDGVIEELSHEEAVLLSCAASEEQEHMPARDDGAIAVAIIDGVPGLAAARNLDRFDPNYVWYEGL